MLATSASGAATLAVITAVSAVTAFFIWVFWIRISGGDASSDRRSSAMPSDKANNAAKNDGKRETIQDTLHSLRADVKALQASMMVVQNNNGEVKNEEEETAALIAAALSRSNVHRHSMNTPQGLVEPAAKCDPSENKNNVRSPPLLESKKTPQEELTFAIEFDKANFATPFETSFKAKDMRQLALVAHNHMKPALKDFIETYGES